MRLIKPLPLTVLATNVAGSVLQEWNADTLYSVGDKVLRDTGTTVHEYESLGNNRMVDPKNNRTMWLDLGPINQSAMFDDRTGTKTTNTGSIEVTFKAQTNGYIDTVAVLALSNADTITVRATLDDVELFEQSYSLVKDVSNWFDYYFAPFEWRESLVVRPGVVKQGAEFTVTITGGATKTVGCGLCMAGLSQWLGDTLYGASVGIEDYSTKEVDEWGNSYLLTRPYSDTANVTLSLPTSQVDALKRALAKVRATPVLYDLNNDSERHALDSLIIFGKYNSFKPTINYHSTSFCDLEVEEII